MFDISGSITSAFLGVLSIVWGLVFNVVGTITSALLSIAVLFFNWVSSSGFIALSYTNPAGNEFIKVGWTLTRDLTNIIFVIALVIIGLATALRISGYQMQKTLPTLIIVALLVNFTPVITGLIVDASNIAMGFFINPEGFSAGQIIANRASSQWQTIGSLVGGAKFWDPRSSGAAMAAAAGSLFLIFFNLITAIIYFLFSLIFIIRYIAIWLLVVLSPFAFACYVLPATRGYFSQWWKMFIQWSIVGVAAGFFLYLNEHLTKVINTTQFIQTSMKDTANAPGFAQIAGALMPFFLPIILLFVGFFAALAGAPQLTQGIMKIAQKAPKQIAGATTSVVRGVPAVQRAEAGARKKLEGVPIIGRALGGVGAYTANLSKLRGAAKGKLEHLSPDELNKVIKMRPLSREDRAKRAAAIEILLERGWFKSDPKTGHERYIPEAMEFGVPEKTIYKAVPHLQKDDTKFADIIKKLRADDIDKFSDEAKADERVIKAIIGTGRADFINRLGSQNTQTQDAVQKQLDENFGKRWASGAQFNRQELELLRNFHSNPASQMLGWKTIGTLDEIENKIQGLGAGKKEPSKVVLPGSKEFTEEQENIKKRVS